jgi:ketosteroid isomerase-like protein
MSEENVEIVRRAYSTFTKTLELPFDGVADEAELDGTGATPDVGVVSDRAAAAKAMRSYAEMFESYSVTLEEVIHASDNLVVTAVMDGGRIKGSPNEVRNRFFHVFTFRDGLIVRFSAHTSKREALQAAGLNGD